MVNQEHADILKEALEVIEHSNIHLDSQDSKNDVKEIEYEEACIDLQKTRNLVKKYEILR